MRRDRSLAEVGADDGRPLRSPGYPGKLTCDRCALVDTHVPLGRWLCAAVTYGACVGTGSPTAVATVVDSLTNAPRALAARVGCARCAVVSPAHRLPPPPLERLDACRRQGLARHLSRGGSRLRLPALVAPERECTGTLRQAGAGAGTCPHAASARRSISALGADGGTGSCIVDTLTQRIIRSAPSAIRRGSRRSFSLSSSSTTVRGTMMSTV